MSLQRIARYTLFGSIFLVPFVPLIVTGSTFFPFITGKNFVFRALVMAAGLSWFFLAVRAPEYRPRRSWLMVAVGVFIALIALADFFGVNPTKSFWSNFERMEGLVALLHLGLFFLVLGSVMTERLWTRFFQTSVGVSVLLSLYGFFQLAGVLVINQGGVRLDATFGNATYLAVYMLMHIFITLWLLYRTPRASLLRWVYVLALALQSIILYYTATRGAILGVLGGLALSGIIIALTDRSHPRLRRGALAGIAVLVVLVGMFVLVRRMSFVATNPILSRFADISLSERTVRSRFTIWSMALDGFKERPVLGWGQENFIYVFGKYYRPEMYNQEPWFDRAHNVFFDWLIAGGVLGLLGYLSLFGLLAWSLWRKNENGMALFDPVERGLFTGLLAGYFFHNIFVFDNIVSYIFFFALLACVHSRMVGRPDANEHVSPPPFNSMQLFAAFTGVVVAVAGFYFFTYKGARASQMLLSTLAQNAKGPAGNLALFQRVLSYSVIGKEEAQEQLTYAAATAYGLSIPDALKKDFIITARVEMEGKLKDDPENPRTPLFLGSMLLRTGDPAGAIHYFEYALERSPRRQLTLFEMGSAYISQKKYTDAVETFKKAFDLAPDYDAARTNYAVALMYAGRGAEAKRLLAERFGETAVNNDALLQAYFETKQYSEVVRIWEVRVAERPRDAQANLSLAAAYLMGGRRGDAIAQIRKVIELDTRFKEQGERLIRDIEAGKNVLQ